MRLSHPISKPAAVLAIGMHGPPRWSKRLGRSNGWFDWTSGCIAFDSDRAIDDVAAWRKDHPDAPIEIR